MTTVEYDLDTSGGIMPEIQALIGPPSTEDSSKRPKKESQRYRRPGRTINHDCCDSCKEGGDLICCDRCPAAFHLQCYNPPIKEEDVPTGEWICHQCNIAKVEDKTAAGSNNMYTKSNAPNKLHSKGSCNDLMMEEKPANGLQLLVKAASTMNPRQFQLPNEYSCPTQFPGASKRPRGKDGRTNHKKSAHELDNGIVPLPAKLCHVCKKSCRVAPLIQCDFCTLLFHLDCLDPPLTTLPPNKWMCPNHAEQIVDQKLLTSLSVTERVKLWDKFAGPISQDAVKMEFFKKIHRRKPPFRYRVKLAQRQRVQVPNAIKEHYKCPPPLLPRVTESPAPLPTSSVATSSPLISQEEQEEWLSSMVAFQVGVAKYLAQKNIVKPTGASSISNDTITASSSSSSFSLKHNDNVRIPTTLENTFSSSSANKVVMNGGGNIFVIPPSESKVTFSPAHSSSPAAAATKQSGVNKNFFNHQNATAANFAAFNGDLEEGKLSGQVEIKTEDVGASPTSVCYSCLNCSTGNTNTLSWSSPPATSIPSTSSRTVVSNSLKSMPKKESLSNNTMVKSGTVRSLITNGNKVALIQSNSNASNSPRILTLQTSCGKSVSTKVSVATSLGNSPAILNLNSNLQACIEGVGEVELNKLDERLVKILAWQRLQQLLPAKSVLLSNSKKPLNGYSSGASNAQARAIICPLTGKGISIPMPYRKLTIGMGADMDVCLSNYGHCNFISAKHACIFYDEITKHYELLNYSEHGTTVDNVLYSCDFSEKHVTPPPASPLAANVRKLSGTTSPTNLPTSKSSDSRNVAPRPTEIWKPCNCKVSSSCLIGGSGAGWEGTAILHHGSYIKCGCLQFIFSILDQAKPAGGGTIGAPEISIPPATSLPHIPDSKPNQKSS